MLTSRTNSRPAGIRKAAAACLALTATGLLTLPSRTAVAQDPFTIAEALAAVKAGLEGAQQAWSIYQSQGTFPAFEPSTADRINDAVNKMENVTIDAASIPILAKSQAVIKKFAMASHNPMPSAAQIQEIDSSADLILDEVELFVPKNTRYAELLGTMYNMILPIYVQVHLRGSQFGIFPIGKSLDEDVRVRLRKGIALDYAMVGGVISGPAAAISRQGTQDTTRNSFMFANVKASAYRSSTGGSDAKCHGDDNLCSAYFQTNPRVQSIQVGAWGLTYLLATMGSAIPSMNDPVLGTVTVLPRASWQANWQGHEDAVWTSMQEHSWGKFVTDRRCPEGSLIIGVWQMPKFDYTSFLCQRSLRIPSFDTTTSSIQLTPKTYSCSGRFCNYGVACDSTDWMVAGGFGSATCYRRLESNNIASPIPASCSVTTVGPNAVVPPKGLITTFAQNTFLTAYDPTSWTSAKRAFFTTCGLPIVKPRTPVSSPLYRYSANGWHFYTTNWNELGSGNGWTFEGSIGGTQPRRSEQSQPFFRYYNPVSGNHFYTTTWAELAEGWQRGWVFEGVEAYVPTFSSSLTKQLHRYYNPTSGDFFYTTNFDELGNGGLGYIYQGVQCNLFNQ
jgi:hypothetical protein